MARKVGARIGELRERKKLSDPRWTQDYLARQVAQHLSGTQMSRYERGENMPGEKRLERIAEVLETTVSDLYAGPEIERVTAGGTDLMGELSEAEEAPSLKRVEDQIAALRVELLAAVASAHKELGDRLSQLERDGRKRKGSRS